MKAASNVINVQQSYQRKSIIMLKWDSNKWWAENPEKKNLLQISIKLSSEFWGSKNKNIRKENDILHIMLLIKSSGESSFSLI